MREFVLHYIWQHKLFVQHDLHTTDGQRIEVRGCDFYEFNGDLVTYKDSYWKIVVV